MSPVVFTDADIPIYAPGGDHPLKEQSARMLRSVDEDPRPIVTDSEILGELLHRYLALGHR